LPRKERKRRAHFDLRYMDARNPACAMPGFRVLTIARRADAAARVL